MTPKRPHDRIEVVMFTPFSSSRDITPLKSGYLLVTRWTTCTLQAHKFITIERYYPKVSQGD